MAATVVQYEDERVRLAKAFPGFFYVFKVFQGSSRFFYVFQVFQRFSRLSTFLPLQETPEPLMLELTWFKFLIFDVDLGERLFYSIHTNVETVDDYTIKDIFPEFCKFYSLL